MNTLFKPIMKMGTDKNIDVIVAFVFVCIAFYSRLLFISKGPLHADVVGASLQALKTLETAQLQYLHFPGYPFFIIMASIFIFLAKSVGVYDPIYVVNFMSVVFGSLSIGIFYLFARKILDRYGALYASVMLCFLPIHFSVSTYGVNNVLSVFLHLLGIYFLILYLETYQLSKLLFSAVILGCGAASRLSDGIIMVAVVFLYLVWSYQKIPLAKKSIIHRLLVFLMLYGATLFLLYIPFLYQHGLGRMTYWGFEHSLGGLLRFSQAALIEIFSAAGLTILFVGVGCFFLKGSRLFFYFLLLWFLCSFVYHGSLNTDQVRYVLLALIPVVVVQGYFLSKTSRPIRPWFSLLFCIIIIFNFCKFLPIAAFRHRFNMQKDFGQMIQHNTKRNDYIIAIDMGGFLEYYGKRKVLHRPTGEDRKIYEKFFKKIDDLLNQGKSIYIITSGIVTYDPPKFFLKDLVRRYDSRYISQGRYEDWHYGSSIGQRFSRERLYELRKKTPQMEL